MSKGLTQDHLDYAKMANDAYKDKFACGPGTDNPNYVVIDSVNMKSGYDAVVYKNTVTGEIIISHRGTEVDFFNPKKTAKDIQADLALAMGKIPQQLKDAENFLKEIAKKYNVKPNQIINSGHSLGGYLSNEIARKFEGKSISFDPPGYVIPAKPKPIVVPEEVLVGQGNNQNGDYSQITEELKIKAKKREQEIKEWEKNFKERQIAKGDITSIVGSPNLVNIVGDQQGNIINVEAGHRIEKIISKIKIQVKPIERKCTAVYDPIANPLGPGHIQVSTAAQNLLSSCTK